MFIELKWIEGTGYHAYLFGILFEFAPITGPLNNLTYLDQQTDELRGDVDLSN